MAFGVTGWSVSDTCLFSSEEQSVLQDTKAVMV